MKNLKKATTPTKDDGGATAVVGSPLKIQCLGGPLDGEVHDIDFYKETISLPDPVNEKKKIKYSDTGELTKQGLIAYRCVSGGGNLKKDFTDRFPLAEPQV